MKIGGVLRFVRKEKGLTLRALSGETGVDISTLHRIERGLPCDPDATVRVTLWLITPEKKVA